MSDETVDPVQRESLIDEEGVGSDLDIERGAKEGKFDYEDSDNDSTVSSSNSTSTLPSTSNSGKRGYRGKGRKKRTLAFRCVNFLKVMELGVVFEESSLVVRYDRCQISPRACDLIVLFTKCS